MLKAIAFVSLLTFSIVSWAQSQVTFEVGTPWITEAKRAIKYDHQTQGLYVHAGITKRKVNSALRYYRSPNTYKGNASNGFGVSMLKVHRFKNAQWFELQYGLSYLYIMERYENPWTKDRNLNLISAEIHSNFYLYKNLYVSTAFSTGRSWEPDGYRSGYRLQTYFPYFLSFGLGYTFK